MTPWIAALAALQIAVYLAGLQAPELVPLLQWTPAEVLQRPWSPLASLLVHTQLTHLLFDLAALALVGPRLERQFGGRGVMGVFLVGGLAGALIGILTPHTPAVGSTAAAAGLLIGYGRFWGREPILPGLPAIASGRWVILTLLVVAMLPDVVERGWRVGRLAVLGGVIGGWQTVRWLVKRNPSRRVEAPNSQYVAPLVRQVEARERWESMDLEGLHEVNRMEVQALLEKVRLRGPASLTERERTFLDRMSEPRQ